MASALLADIEAGQAEGKGVHLGDQVLQGFTAEAGALEAVVDQLKVGAEFSDRGVVQLWGWGRGQHPLAEFRQGRTRFTRGFPAGAGQLLVALMGEFEALQHVAELEAVRLKAVEFAKRQVLAGKPYVWGDEGPGAFDCSGLVYAAYKSAGLGWPIWDRLNSGLYYTYTKQIPLSEMQPGDLIFYSYKGTISTIHHMSIYAGGGMMWEANSKGKGLLYSNIYSVKGLMPFGGRV